MWWGRGDSSRLDEDQLRTLAHLRRLEETGHLKTLNAEQSDAGIAAVEFFAQWQSVLKLMGSIKNVALLVGAILAIWWATEGWLIAKVASTVGTGE